MKGRVIRGSTIKEKNFGHTKVATILNSPNFNRFSIARVRKVGNEIQSGFDRSDVVYYVLAGSGTTILNKKKYVVKRGDVIVSPKGTVYKNLKGLTLLAISSPRFSRKSRTYVE